MEEPELADLTVPQAQICGPFRPLDKHRNEVRILCLYRGDQSDPISCTTSHAYLDTNPSYEALSYVWGDPNETHPITFNGSRFQATVNLVAALKRFRLPNDDRRLWVDALCINQDDEDEKCRQVALMGRIYSNTTIGIMWLGDTEEEPSSSSSPAANSYGSRPIISRSCALESFNLIVRLASGVHLDADRNNSETNTTPGTLYGIGSLATLLNLSWWQRIWTVQEVVLPRHVVFQCGDLKLSLETFDEAVKNIQLHEERNCCHIHPDDESTLSDFDTRIGGIMIFRESAGDCETLILALNTFSHRLATDKRDKVFGLLGILSGFALSSTIDYTLTYAEVYTNTAIELMRSCRSLVPLLSTVNTELDPLLASWVPNWGSNLKRPGDGAWELEIFMNSNAAAGCPVVFGHICHTTLSLMGFYVDQITCCIRGHVPDTKMGFEHLTRIASRYLPLNYPFGGTCQDAFAELVQFDREMVQPVYFITCKGLLGISDSRAVSGDIVYILSGGNMPFIVRPVANPPSPKQYFKYVGHSYVHGLMNGELLQREPAMHWVYLI